MKVFEKSCKFVSKEKGGNAPLAYDDFFDELNWQDPVSNKNPFSGAIDPGGSVNLTLVIRDTSQTVVAYGDMRCGCRCRPLR